MRMPMWRSVLGSGFKRYVGNGLSIVERFEQEKLASVKKYLSQKMKFCNWQESMIELKVTHTTVAANALG
jgi:hypothetical protein